ncbi:5-amino-6-(5-phospho-D-ribitylamino)uracil phosphatase, chloroplastic-like [Lolium rigidum]|uniref:5-amino-6-(5-phospho-D-ribitylamino)uracil phosphatase, chloroplastic-like n=1 Tax=Lolium rigidum TaxID=89674 RepID=UPI001F5C848F|nr:5-amino-6-(5-phospho-D-ribitylamino)uracil phosphatase, chloroplastic-like [Lolium rigidum]
MISSISLLDSQLIHRRYRKCWPSNPHSTLNMHSIAKCLGKSMRMKMALLKPHATGFKRNPQAHEEDNVFYKLVYRLPESLSWLLASQERVKRPAAKKKQQKEGTVAGNRFGVILEWEGVVVENDDPDLEPRVWYVLSLEEAKTFPPDAMLKEIEGMRTDQAISEVLNWSEDPKEIKRLAARKEVIYQKLRGRFYQLRPGVLDFLNTLVEFDIPIAIAASRPRKSLEEGIRAVGLKGYFDAIVAAEDFRRGKPEGEMFEAAAKQLSLKPDACLVMGSSNLTTESVHAAGMRCVAVASRHPVYELRAANHVVRWLDQLSVVDLQRLADGEVLGSRGRRSDMDMEIVIEE